MAGGSWIGTCSPASWDGRMLSAYCKTGSKDAFTYSTFDTGFLPGYSVSAPGYGVSLRNNKGSLVA